MSLVTRGMGRVAGPMATGGMGRVQRTAAVLYTRIRDFVVRITTYLNLEVIR